MKRFIIFLIFQIFLLSCSGMHKRYDVATFGSYVDKFEAYSEIYGEEKIEVTDLIIEFDDLDGEIVGLCNKYSNRVPKITIDKEWWNDLLRNDAEREILMLHELGHCILDRGHNDNFLPTGENESIMYYRVIPYSYYIISKGYYLNELFNGRENTTEGYDPGDECRH